MKITTIILLIICVVVTFWVLAVFLRGSAVSRLVVPFYATFVVGFSGVFLGHPKYELYLAMVFACVVSPAIIGSVMRWFDNRAKHKHLEAMRADHNGPTV